MGESDTGLARFATEKRAGLAEKYFYFPRIAWIYFLKFRFLNFFHLALFSKN